MIDFKRAVLYALIEYWHFVRANLHECSTVYYVKTKCGSQQYKHTHRYILRFYVYICNALRGTLMLYRIRYRTCVSSLTYYKEPVLYRCVLVVSMGHLETPIESRNLDVKNKFWPINVFHCINLHFPRLLIYGPEKKPIFFQIKFWGFRSVEGGFGGGYPNRSPVETTSAYNSSDVERSGTWMFKFVFSSFSFSGFPLFDGVFINHLFFKVEEFQTTKLSDDENHINRNAVKHIKKATSKKR